MSVQEKTRTVEVFDPAMCCSTGVCGPSVDPALARFAGDVEWLEGQGVEVRRYNLAQQPGAFAEREDVTAALHEHGEGCLPLVFVDGELASQGAYPARAELAHITGVKAPATAESVWDPAVKELVAIAAAVASNCEPCLEHHVAVARELGVGDEDLVRAVRTAKAVKETPARNVLAAADRLLGAQPDTPAEALRLVEVNGKGGGGCCS